MLHVIAQRSQNLIIQNFFNLRCSSVIFLIDPSGTFYPNVRLCGLRSDHLLNTIAKTEASQQHMRSIKLFADLFCVRVLVCLLYEKLYI